MGAWMRATADADGFVWIGKGDCHGNFTLLDPVPIGDSPGAISLADMNGDGHLDVVTSTLPLLAGTIYGDAAGNLLTVALGDGKGNFSESQLRRYGNVLRARDRGFQWRRASRRGVRQPGYGYRDGLAE